MAEGTVKVRGQYAFAMCPEKLLTDTAIEPRAVRLWCILARIANDPNAEMPARARLADLIKASPSTLDRHLTELIDAGWLIKIPRRGGINDYELIPDPVAYRKRPPLRTLVMGDDPPSSPVTTPTSLYESSESSTSRGRRATSGRNPKWTPKEADDHGQDTGRTSSGERALGADPEPAPIAHRPGGGPWLAWYFEHECTRAFAKHNLPPGQFDGRKMARNFKLWLERDGIPADQIRALIDVWCIDARPVPGLPLWRGFLGSKDRLWDRASGLADSQRDAGEVYTDLPDDRGQDW